MSSKGEPTNQEILEAINAFSTNVDEEFKKIRSTMVTKDYLDEKNADLRGDIINIMRKEDKKIKQLINFLVEEKVISSDQKQKLYSMEPFAELM